MCVTLSDIVDAALNDGIEFARDIAHDLLSQGICTSHDCDRRICLVCHSAFKLHMRETFSISISPSHYSVLTSTISNVCQHSSLLLASLAHTTQYSANTSRISHFTESEIAAWTDLPMDFVAFNNMLGNVDGNQSEVPANGCPI